MERDQKIIAIGAAVDKPRRRERQADYVPSGIAQVTQYLKCDVHILTVTKLPMLLMFPPIPYLSWCYQVYF